MEANGETRADERAVRVFPFADGWPSDVQDQSARLFEFDLQQVEGKDRLGALAFNEAPQLVEQIRTVVTDLAKEPWAELHTVVTGQLLGQLTQTNDVIDAMISLTSQQPDAATQQEAQIDRLRQQAQWFHDEAWPRAQRAAIDRRLAERGEEAPGEEQLKSLQVEYARLRHDAEEVRRELESRRDLANQFREAARESAGEELAAVFRGVARKRGDTARTWLIALGIAGLIAAGGAILIFRAVRPSGGATDSHDYAALGLGVFLLGLLAFGVRICAQNYRVNRHQQAVADAKASAISTFQRITGSVEEQEVRSAVTLALAQAIFTAEETGLMDTSGDHVTLVERAVIPRLPGGG